ncbi:MAG: hypothetical protein Q9208_008490 [Pyrenodesmia sp. 3 TL-2023]
MGQIYSTAREVWVWLGRSTETPSRTSISDIIDLSKQSEVHDIGRKIRPKLLLPRSHRHDTWLKKLDQLFCRGYWFRLWVTQEFLKARTITIWDGDDSFGAADLWSYISVIPILQPIYPRASARAKILNSVAYNLLKLRSSLDDRIEDLQAFESVNRRLEEVVFSHSFKDCADWHDRIYGVLSLGRDGERFPVDYSINKIDFLMTVIPFQTQDDWPLIWGISLILSELLGISDMGLLRYGRNNLALTGLQSMLDPALSYPSAESQQINPAQGWNIVALRRRSIIGEGSRITSNEWLLSSLDMSSAFAIKGVPFRPLRMCQCHHCTSRPLPSLATGDEIYDLDFFLYDPSRFRFRPAKNHQTLLVLRPNAHSRSGYRLFGVIGTENLHEQDMYLYPPPHHLSAAYELGDHLCPDPQDDALLLLDLDPPTLCFLMRSFVLKDAKELTQDYRIPVWGYGPSCQDGTSLLQSWSSGLTRSQLQNVSLKISKGLVISHAGMWPHP